MDSKLLEIVMFVLYKNKILLKKIRFDSNLSICRETFSIKSFLSANYYII